MDINLSAPCNMLGFGIVGVNLLASLVEQGHEVALWPIPSQDRVEAHPKHHGSIRTGVANQEFYNKDAPSIRHWHPFDLAQHVGCGPRIGSTVFELDRFTDRELHHLRSQDGLAVPTSWGKRILEENGITLPICVLPHGVDREIFNELVQPALPELGKNNTTVFVHCGKIEIRKSTDILLDVFNKAFESTDNVHLIVSFYNPFMTEAENKEWADLYLNSKLGSKITVIPGRLATQQDVAALMATADVGIFMAHSEGFNLEAIELLSLGKHLIITNYSGHTEFATDDNSLLIEQVDLEMAYDGRWFDGKTGRWMSIGEAEIDQAVDYMRIIHTKKQQGELRSNEPGIETAKQFSWDAAALKLVNFLKNF